jgi:DeoR family glycerol-3-phosphate regulon repressor
VRPGDLACAGSQALEFFDDLYADLAFLGSGGVHAQAGLTDYHLDEVDVRRVMLERAARSYALADASKLGTIAARRVCGLDRLAGLVTDAPPPPDLAEALALAGVDVVVGAP